MEITFVNPNYLWLLFIIPVLILTHFYGLRFSRKKAIKFANFEALARVSGAHRLSMNLPLLFLRFFTLFFLIFALSGPILWYTGKGGNFDFVIGIDSSGSMLTTDFTPNRMEAAKGSALTFVDNIPKDSLVGVMSFAGTTFVKQSLTSDFKKVKSAISGIQVEYSSGTGIGDAIIAGSNIFTEDDKGRVIVLLTDGQSNVGTVIEKAINYANDKHVTINTIGVATTAGAKMPGMEAISTIDENSLQLIAQNTGGKFYKAGNNDELSKAYTEIAKTSSKKMPMQLAFWLIILTFLTLSIEWVIVNTKFRSVP